MFVKEFFDETFLTYFVIAVGPFDEFKEWLKMYGIKRIEEEGGYCISLVHNDYHHYIVWLPSFNSKNPSDIATLVHECSHATTFTIQRCKLSPKDDENRSYILAFYMKKCMEYLLSDEYLDTLS